MPRSTHRYHFEIRVVQALDKLLGPLRRFVGDAESVLFLRWPDGRVEVCTGYDGYVPPLMERADKAEKDDVAMIFLDPLEDGMEYVALRWSGVSRELLEQILGEPLTPQDFQDLNGGEVREWPESWSVMF